jgi:hypothetical protein
MIDSCSIDSNVSDRAYAFALDMSRYMFKEIDIHLENKIYNYFYWSTGFESRSSVFEVLYSAMEKG